MSRYIDADALREEWLYENGTFEPNDVLDSIDCQPTVDAVQVVRCGECKHYKDGMCYNPNTYDDEKTCGNTTADWFCADGKRKDGE